MKKETRRKEPCKICGGVIRGARRIIYCAECYLVQKHTTFIKQDGVVISKISKSGLIQWRSKTKRPCPFPVMTDGETISMRKDKML